MVYSILSEARVRHSVAPKQADSINYQVVWDENRNLKDWTTFVNLDVVGAWGGFLFGTKRTSSDGYISPSSDFPPVDSIVNDRIFFRLKYDRHPRSQGATTFGKITWTTVSDPLFDDNKSITFDVQADGKWHFYEINMGESPFWVGDITRVRFFPCEDGWFNDEFFLGFFEIGSNVFDFSFDRDSAGTPGFVEGAGTLTQAITIEKDVNDKLLVNIDDYGDVQITLTPQTAQPFLIARDISLQLGKVGVGGYPRAEAFLTEDFRLRIESGTRAADSRVSISDGDNSAANILGLTDEVGFFIGVSGDGTDPDPTYTPLSSYKPTTQEILALFDNDDDLPAFSLNPQTPIVQAGNADYSVINQRLRQEVLFEGRNTGLQGVTIEQTGALDGSATTFIDLNHPFSDEGKVDRIYMNGIPETDGSSKWKIFRPRLNGDLDLVAEGVIGFKDFVDDPNGGIVASPVPGVFVADVSTSSVFVRRGDLLGIFNVGLHAGKGNSVKPDALYYAISGDVTGTITPPPPSGAGETGLAIYAEGLATKDRAVVDIDFRRRLNIDRVRVTGDEDQRDLEYNVGIATSAVYNSDTGGLSHTICYNPTPTIRTCFERTNRGYNIQALNDGITDAENGKVGFGDGGPSGLGGADVGGSTYFYVNGDAEFLNEFEFVNQNPGAYDFTRDPIGLECFFSNQTPRLDKPIGKLAMYFKEKKNQRSWQLEHLEGQGGKGGNGSKPGFSIVPADSITSVRMDNRLLEPFGGIALKEGYFNLLLDNPVVLDVIANDGTRNPQIGVDFTRSVAELGGVNFRDQATFIEFQWNRFEWTFDAIRTAAFRWYSDFHWSTKITEMEVYAVSESNESLGDNVQVLFSADGLNFATAELSNANEKEAEYKIGNSPQFMRLILRPTLQTSLNDIKIDFEEDQVCFGEEGRIQGATALTEGRIGSPGASTPLKIGNSTGQTADLLVDVPEDISSARQLLYFNQLNSQDDIQKPQVGPPGRVDFNPDKILSEQRSVTVNAQAYGLLALTSGTESFRSDNLAVNGGFQLGTEDGWNVNVTNSGSLSFQQPKVDDFSLGTTPSIQGGSFSWGSVQDDDIPSQQSQNADIAFTIGQTHDVSQFATGIDAGASTFEWQVRYAHYGAGPNPRFRVYGAPTLSGVEAAAGTIVDPDYGSNILSDFFGEKSQGSGNADTGNPTHLGKVNIKSGTRFIRTEIDVNITGPQNDGFGNYLRLIFHMDAYSANVVTPAVDSTKWYKSYFTGVGDFTDASFQPVDPSLIVAVTGSHHWYQPARANATITSGPFVTQSPGYDLAFTQDRNEGVQAFARMTSSDPGFLGMQWSGEKKIAGIRIANARNTNGSCVFTQNYPRFWDIEVLERESVLGEPPDANNNEHWKVVRRMRGDLIREQTPEFLSTFQTGTGGFGGAHAKITTWLFDEPVFTEGVRVTYVLNCDIYERNAYANYNSFNATTGCLNNQTFVIDFASSRGIYTSMFTALESVGRTTLPVDDTPDRELTPGVADCGGAGGVVYAAVDLGRHFDIETNTDLFELISDATRQAPWPGTALFGDEDTDDPNAVTWSASASFARWIRFSTPAQNRAEFEPEIAGSTTGDTSNNSPYQVTDLPQGILVQARVYPKLQSAGIPTQGPNHFWENLGNILTDNRNTTFINYSEWPVVALDLNRPYKIRKTSATTVLRRDLIAPGPLQNDDKLYWDVNNDDGFAYASKAFGGTGNPSNVEYGSWGASVPDIAVRWVAVRGVENLLQVDGTEADKEYNFDTQGNILYGINFAPEENEIFTENSNWFSTATAALRDLSTFDTTQGNPFSIQEDVDYGSNGPASQDGTFGDPYFVWDGRFDLNEDDFWGIGLRDPDTGLNIAGNEFPHYVWRVFRDLYRGTIDSKEVKAVTIVGYDETYYPTDFQIQYLEEDDLDPTVDANWTTIPQASFTGVDTFNEGIGFTYILPETITTQGIRIYVTDSVYADDSITGGVNEIGGFNQAPLDRGPQTRIVSVTVYEEVVEEAAIQGTIETDHAQGASITSLTEVPNQGPANMIDGVPRTFWQATGFSDTITVTLDAPRTINRLEWEMSQNYAQQFSLDPISTNAPGTFRLKANENIVFETFLEQEDFEGLTFSGTLNPPVTADTFVFEIDEPQGIDADASSIVIHRLSLIEEVTQSEPLLTVGDVFDRRPGSENQRSTLVTYAANSSAIANLFLDGIDANNDEYFSERDFFTFWVWINDVSLLDQDFGVIRIGNDRNTFYSWKINTLDLNSGWNELRLQFKEAFDRSAIEFQPGPNYDPDTGESKVDFVTADAVITSNVDGNFSRRIEEAPGIRFFEMQFRGVGADRELELILDDMRFIRNRFDDVCKFTPSLYLNNSETFTIYLEGLDLAVGTVEFWFQPDWDITGRIDRLRDIMPSIFKITRPDGKFLSFYYRPAEGFTAVINAGNEVLQFKSRFAPYAFEKFDTMHVALVWDSLGRIPPNGATMRMLVNGENVFATTRTWAGLREGGATFMFGGEVGQALAAVRHNDTALTFTAVPSLPQTNTASAWALLENIKVYNYAKTDFSDINNRDLTRTQLLKPSEMLQVSLDGINWYSSGSDNLPLVVKDVPPGGEATVYMRSNIPRDITGDEERDASLLVRWKTPLIDCD